MSKNVVSTTESVSEKLFIAHVRQNPSGAWIAHSLEDHLQSVAKLAKKFAEKFNAASWAELAGLWHDLGKYSREFQNMIRSASGLDAHIEIQFGLDEISYE